MAGPTEADGGAAEDLVFGRFRLSLSQRRLWADGEPARLGPRALDVLLALAQRRGSIVGKNELLDIVWPDTVVEENNLQVHIWALRKLLGPEAIITIPGHGYRFSAAATGPAPAVGVAPPQQQPAAADGAAPQRPRLASHLPAQLPALIGRDADLDALVPLLGTQALVTIVGAGGMGKTRLAQRLQQVRQPLHADGACWVELAGLSDPALVVGAMASALGIGLGNGDPLAGLVSALKPLDALLVLDNAEHLADEVARVVQALLEALPRLHLLVTSQVPLKLPAEHVFRLGPLSVPGDEVPLAEARGHGAIALFTQRAQAADRLFMLTEQNLPAVRQVCAGLDGLALAIELAAARLPLLGMARLAASLDERLRLLTRGQRGAPPRQQTLRAALDWSLALLQPAEQRAFRRLGVFAGGFTLDMARAVVTDAPGTPGSAAEPALDDWDVVDALGVLVERSLVTTDGIAGGALADAADPPPRYRLLETARAHALEQLAAAGEQPALRRRHAHAVAHLLADADAQAWAGRIGLDAACARLEPELDNVREAMAWALAHDPALALAMAPGMDLALTRDRRPEARAMWEATGALAASPAAEALDDTLRARWSLACAAFWALHKPVPSIAAANEALARFERLGDPQGCYLALAVGVLNRTPEAEAPYPVHRAALQRLQALEQPGWPPRVLHAGARAEFFLELFCRDVEATSAAAQRCLVLAQAMGDGAGINAALLNLADLALTAGRAADAVRHGLQLEQRLAGLRAAQSNLAFARLNLTAACLALDDTALARQVAQRGWPMAPLFDLQDSWSDSLSLLAALEKRPRCAALLRGYGDAAYARSGFTPEANEVRIAERGLALMQAQLDEATFTRLRAAGAHLADADVAALAFAEGDAGG
ncbi:ATP-binding protein [Aquabacterium sp.]|uniref:ATP-binding protein n=1 Tax=Aquabacterium sp. TaxID=1872578 RepID=UPI003783EF09